MSFSYWITVAAVAFLPLAATAQQFQLPSPSDANATVPAVGYVSAFDNYRAMPEEKTSPDQVWRAANQELTGQDTHGGPIAMPGMGSGDSGNHMSMSGMGATKPEPKTDAATSGPHAGHPNMQGK